ncbi:hypothetical protein GCM10027589_02380 [Actinocorallia lasiicapitis]
MGLWLLASISVAWFSIVVIRVVPHDGVWPDYLGRWNQWDSDRFRWLAANGYDGAPTAIYPRSEEWPAFFPGYPLAIRLVGLIFHDYRAAGIVVSLLAGAVASVAFSRLGNDPATLPRTFATRPNLGKSPLQWWEEAVGKERGPGFYAVLALVASPCAVFLFAAYSEALFLALAVPAWLLAKRGRWEFAVLFAAGASIVRITGFFLAIGLIVEFLVGKNGRRGPGGWRNAPYLVTPFLSIGAYMAYQWHRTGDWMAWSHAQKAGWNRSIVSPLQSFRTTWDAAFHVDNEWTNAFRVEIAAAVVGLLLVAWLLYQAQWAEAVYVGSQLAALMVSEYYLSIGRATLVWFPLWIALGHLALRRRWLYNGYLALSLPLMGAFVLSFIQGQWTG